MTALARTLEPGLLPAGGGTLDGPWVQAFWFTVPGPVVSKSNHRKGDTSRSRSWHTITAYQLAVTAAAREHRPAGWEPGGPGPVAGRPRMIVYALARTMLDAGNVDKSILDALEGPVMRDDAQVGWSLSAVTRTREEPGVLISVARLAPDAPLHRQAVAAAALITAATDLVTSAPTE